MADRIVSRDRQLVPMTQRIEHRSSKAGVVGSIPTGTREDSIG